MTSTDPMEAARLARAARLAERRGDSATAEQLRAEIADSATAKPPSPPEPPQQVAPRPGMRPRLRKGRETIDERIHRELAERRKPSRQRIRVG